MIYGNGLSMIPFASKITIVRGMLTPTRIPNKTKPSFLSIIHQKSVLLRV